MLAIDFTALIVFALVWVLVIILSKFFFKPINKILDKRASLLAHDREQSAKALETYEAEVRRVEESIKEARAAASAVRAKAEAEALAEKSKALLELQAESRAQLERSREELRRQAELLKKELDEHVDEVAGDMEKRILS